MSCHASVSLLSILAAKIVEGCSFTLCHSDCTKQPEHRISCLQERVCLCLWYSNVGEADCGYVQSGTHLSEAVEHRKDMSLERKAVPLAHHHATGAVVSRFRRGQLPLIPKCGLQEFGNKSAVSVASPDYREIQGNQGCAQVGLVIQMFGRDSNHNMIRISDSAIAPFPNRNLTKDEPQPQQLKMLDGTLSTKTCFFAAELDPPSNSL